MFAGQRDDPFFGDVGAIFDLLAFRKDTGQNGGGKDFLAGYAVHSIALQIPISQVDTKSHAIGIWSTADRKGSASPARERLGAGLPPRQPADQRVVIPTAATRTSGTRPARPGGQFVVLLDADPGGGDNKLYKLGVQEKNRSDLVRAPDGGPKLNFTGTKPRRSSGSTCRSR